MAARTPNRSTVTLVAAIAAFFVLGVPHERPLTTAHAAPQDPLARPATPDPTPKAGTPIEAIDRKLDLLTGALIARVDEAEAADLRREEQRLATALALVPLNEAARQARGAELALMEYKEKTYPAELRQVDEEIRFLEAEVGRAADRLEWSKEMMRNKLLSDAQHGNDKAAHVRSQLLLKQSRDQKETLESTTRPRRLAELVGEIEKAADELQLKTFLHDREKAREARADLDAHAAALNLAESRSLALVLDARSIRDRAAREAEPAAKARLLDEAAGALRRAEARWSEASALRAESRRVDLESRLRRAASEAARKAVPPLPARPEPGRSPG